MENLDDLMRKKFDADDPAARFEFQEEFWEQAQALIETDERNRRRRRRFIIWWWSAGLLLLVAGVWYCHTLRQPDGHESYTLHTPGQENKTTTTQPTTSTTTPRGWEKTGSTAQPTTAHNSGQENKTTTTQPTTSTTTPRGWEKTGGTTQPTTTHTPGQGNKTTTTQPATTQPATISSSTPRGWEKPGDTAPVQLPGHPIIPTSSAAAPTAPTQPHPDTTTATRQPIAQARSSALAPLPPLPGELLPLLPLPLLPPQASIAPPPPIQPHHEQPWSLTLSGAASAFFPQNHSAQAGASADISLAYRISNRWSVQGGLGWRSLPVNALATDSGGYTLLSNQLRYAFGYERTNTDLRPSALHTIELPMALRWHPLRHAWAEGSLSLNRLMGVRGEWHQQVSSSLHPDPIQSIRRVWVPERGYRKLWLSPGIGAGWQQSRWSASLHALAVPADLVPPIVPDAPARKGWLLNWQIGLGWRIF